MNDDPHKFADLSITRETIKAFAEAMSAMVPIVMKVMEPFLQLSDEFHRCTIWHDQVTHRDPRAFYRQGKHLGFKKRWKRRRK